MCNHILVRNGNDVSHQSHPVQQKQLALVAGVFLVTLMAGIGGYVFAIRNNHKQPYAQISPSVIPISPGWKLLQSKYMDFTLQYPSNLSLEGPIPVEEKTYKPGDRIIFNSANPDGQLIGLSIFDVTEDITNRQFLIGVLLTAPVGNVPTGSIKNYSDNVITKIADLTINGHRAVHATFFRKGGTYQAPRFCESYLIVKDSKHYYLLATCTTNATSYRGLKAKVTQYSSLIEQIVNTFTIN